MIRKLSELGLTGLEDFQDKSGEGRFGVSSIRDSASQHLPCVDRDRHGFDGFTLACLTYISTILPFLRLTCITLLSGNMYLRQL